MSRMKRLMTVAIAVAVCSLVVPSLASAHERREIGDGRYQLVVGFSSEPAYTGFLNGLDLRVSDLSRATPAAIGTTQALYSPGARKRGSIVSGIF